VTRALRPARPRARAALLLALALVAATATACVIPPVDPPGGPPLGPDGDAFYVPPSPLPAGQKGDVIWYRPTTFGLSSTVKSFKILYRSTTATNQATAVSGTILVPTAAWTGPGQRPIVAYAVGTQGLGDGCAPSKAMPTGLLYEQGTVQQALDKGWAVVVTDYQGLGTPGDHTYIIRKAEAHAVLDALRAASRLPEAGLSANAPVGIWGYSQGGQAAAAAGELEPTYAPELDLKGVAAGGVPADLNRVAQNLDGSLFFAFLGAAAIGLDTAYGELDLDTYLNDTGRAALADARDDCLIDALLKYSFQTIDNYTDVNPLPTAAWQARINEQKLGTVAPQAPVLLYHATLDEVIPLDQAVALRGSYCAKGVKVSWNEYLFAEHLLGIFNGAPDATTWLADRFAGNPQTRFC
jgi:dienelactone hydrolase